MKNINPLYIIGLVFVIVVISFIQKEKKYEKFLNSYQTLKQYNSIANQYANIRLWYDKNTILELTKKLEKNNPALKIKTKIKNQYLVIQIDSTDTQKLENALNKLLNKAILISKMTISKNRVLISVFIGVNL
jgi:uncharacterized protein involved in exopolysaccharide biosynthesis